MEVCGGHEKNQLHGGMWRSEGGPAFIPVSDATSSSLVRQTIQRTAEQSDEEAG